MSQLAGLHGGVALGLICVLILAEETGVPLPLLPGDLLLLTAGVLIANGALSPWAFFPLAGVASLVGALLAYWWARTLGARGLQALATRLRAGGLLERATARLHAAGPLGIVAGRLLPGTRVYTAMVAGATRIPLPAFLTGLVPSIVVWLGGFTAIGMLVGVPAARALGSVQRVALNAALLLVIAAATYVVLWHTGRHAPSPFEGAPRRWRVGAAVVIDAALALAALTGVAELVEEVLNVPDLGGALLEVLGGGVILAYVLGMRRGVGGTAGEALLGVHYRRARSDPV